MFELFNLLLQLGHVEISKVVWAASPAKLTDQSKLDMCNKNAGQDLLLFIQNPIKLLLKTLRVICGSRLFFAKGLKVVLNLLEFKVGVGNLLLLGLDHLLKLLDLVVESG